MDNALEALLSWQFVLFCLAITTLTFVIRKIVDYGFHLCKKVAKDSHLWTDLILPVLPVLLGSLVALLAAQYPYPLDISSVSGRIFFGLCAGMLSTFIWRWVKAALSNKIKNIKNLTPPSNPLNK